MEFRFYFYEYSLIILLIGFFIGSIGIYLIIRPKLKTTQKLDIETKQQNIELKKEFDILNAAFNKIQIQTKEASNALEQLEQQSKKAADIFYEKNMEIAKSNLEKSIEKLSSEIQKEKEEYQKDFLQMLEENANNFNKTIEERQIELKSLDEKFAREQAIVNAAIEANKRAKEIEEQSNFYRLQLSDIDIKEIAELRSIIPKLRNAEPINKVIWKVYYEKPYTDLVGRVIGLGQHTGIYKITNTINNMCYVGQAANLADRWKQHIKRGVGAETPTRNKLYPAMQEYGVENFTFEVIEECDRSLLDKQEDYWQDYFKAKEFGYSIK